MDRFAPKQRATVTDGLTAGAEDGAAALGAELGGAVGGAGSATVSPARHLSTYAFSVTLAAWYAALLALHSSRQAFTVFCAAEVAAEGEGAGFAPGVDAGCAAEPPARHWATYAFSVMPLA